MNKENIKYQINNKYTFKEYFFINHLLSFKSPKRFLVLFLLMVIILLEYYFFNDRLGELSYILRILSIVIIFVLALLVFVEAILLFAIFRRRKLFPLSETTILSDTEVYSISNDIEIKVKYPSVKNLAINSQYITFTIKDTYTPGVFKVEEKQLRDEIYQFMLGKSQIL